MPVKPGASYCPTHHALCVLPAVPWSERYVIMAPSWTTADDAGELDGWAESLEPWTVPY